MTIRDLYDYALIEMNKVEAPSLLLEDFNYFMNKAVQQYINKVYNRYDINQQSSDDLRVLKATTRLELTKQVYSKFANIPDGKFSYVTDLPDDYMHILNCIVEYEVNSNYKCYKTGDHVDFAAKRLTADMAAGILHNVYMKPDYKRPYFYINNVDKIGTYEEADVSAKSNNKYRDSKKDENSRYGNSSKVRLELRIGSDDSIFTPKYIYVDYIKAPMFIRLTYDDISGTQDNTEALEFPDYVCYEIVNEFVKLLMENASDPRLQTNYAINQTVADPTAVSASQSSRDKS